MRLRSQGAVPTIVIPDDPPPPPFNFEGLLAENRIAVYKYYFGDAYLRLTRTEGEARTRMRYKSSVALMLVSKAVYLECHPLYWSCATLILKNTRAEDFINCKKGCSSLQFVQRIELVNKFSSPLDTTQFPALKTLILSFPGGRPLNIAWPRPQSLGEAIGYIEGDFDDSLKAKAKEEVMTARSVSPWRLRAWPGTPTSLHWLATAVDDPNRQFDIINTLCAGIRYSSRPSFVGGSGEESINGRLGIEFNIDTLETLSRTWIDIDRRTKRFWRDGKDEIFALGKHESCGRLLESSAIEK